MSLALTFSSCQGARAGPRAPEQRGGRLLCALSVFSEGENWLKGCQRTWKHTSIRAHAHTQAARSRFFSLLSAALPVRTECLKWFGGKKKKRTRTHTRAALITRVFLPVFVVLGLQKHEGGEQSPRSNTGVRTSDLTKENGPQWETVRVLALQREQRERTRPDALFVKWQLQKKKFTRLPFAAWKSTRSRRS